MQSKLKDKTGKEIKNSENEKKARILTKEGSN